MTNISGSLSFSPDCLPLLVGSLPIEDHDEATRLMLEYTPEIPLWIQLPIYREEGMLYQFLPGMPGLKRRGDDFFIDTQSSSFEDELLAFYEDYMAFYDALQDYNLDSECRFALTDTTARGFSSFMKIISKLPNVPVSLKGQVTGPITMGIGVKDEAGKLLFYDERLRDVVIKQVAMNAAWQVRTLLALKSRQKPIIFFDEPGVVGFGSSTYISISREQIVESLGECIDAVHAAGGIAGIHICANGDWSLAFESGTDIINFDAWSFFDRVILYRDHLKDFILRGGILAWGIVPTSSPEHIEAASSEKLFEMWQGELEQIKALGIDERKILSQTLITPSCGTGSLDPAHALKVLELVRDLSCAIRKHYCL
ncbi:conserved hypothetical protein [Desulfamplus magnetovallimortis]|uniref:Methionine synthase n=1 Tax=Desulfamplus magnetovallimortis TaxID=1246637 RepID=A0A1W1HGC0_9BACT|nr:hypothetical protein [Desulfamplus magnetovallimortis]SLM31561.1 conserved hypothetical protein [Desulfamplus magnetovallimortis]